MDPILIENLGGEGVEKWLYCELGGWKALFVCWELGDKLLQVWKVDCRL